MPGSINVAAVQVWLPNGPAVFVQDPALARFVLTKENTRAAPMPSFSSTPDDLEFDKANVVFESEAALASCDEALWSLQGC